jgi:glycosyltransferase involved in cell wall biosynthesis
VNIGIITEPLWVGGPFKITLKQAFNLASFGHSVNVIMPEDGFKQAVGVFGELFKGFDVTKYSEVPILSRVVRYMSRPYRTFKVENKGEVNIDPAGIILNAPFLSRLLEKRKCEALICHSTLSPLSALGFYAVSGARKVLFVHDIPVHLMMQIEKVTKVSGIVKVLKCVETWVVRKSDFMACTTEKAAYYWRNIFSINPKIIHPGCDPSQDFPYPKQNYFLSVTRWDISRGAMFFLDLAERFKASAVSIVLAGNWPVQGTFELMQNAILKRGLKEKITLLKDPSEPELTRLYREARCFMAPPVRGALLMGSLEAAAQGTPIVYPLDSSAWEIFTPGVHGLQSLSWDLNSYYECASKFEDEDTVRKMGFSIWKKSQECTWSIRAKELERIIC